MQSVSAPQALNTRSTNISNFQTSEFLIPGLKTVNATKKIQPVPHFVFILDVSYIVEIPCAATY
jgi:hypothetical protein